MAFTTISPTMAYQSSVSSLDNKSVIEASISKCPNHSPGAGRRLKTSITAMVTNGTLIAPIMPASNNADPSQYGGVYCS